MFRKLSIDEKATIAPGLRNEGRFRIISDDKNVWVLKHSRNPDNEKRDLLAYLLGKDFCNVPEIKLLTQQELEEIKQFASAGESFDINNTFLVRLGHSYKPDELHCKNLEEAVATELVYSVWIRRRDTHIDNRVYIKGIPIFFDFHIAFLGEPDLTDINVFFSQTQDHGRAGLWRVKIWSSFLAQFTGAMNTIEIGHFHYVNDMDTFYKQIEKNKIVLKEKAKDQIENCVRQVKFESTKEVEIINFLNKNLETLDADVNKMLEIIR